VEPPEAAVGVLRHVHRLCEPGGVLLHLTCLPVPDRIETGGCSLGELDQTAFIEGVEITEHAVDLLVAEGLLADEARLEHDVLVHFASGPEALEHFAGTTRSRVTPELQARLRRIDAPVVQRAACVWRQLRVLAG
jgi:hypothetical protein